MTLPHISWRYLWARPLVSALTILGVALGVALVSSVLTVRRETMSTLMNEAGLYDLVVGAKGSPLQLILSSIYHLDLPTGNIPHDRYEALKADRRVRLAVPIGLGDNYRGFRIVGTEPHFFDLQRRDGKTAGDTAVFSVAEGRLFDKSFEAVLGADVVRQSGLGLGDTFAGTHGLVALAGSEEHSEFPFTVTGILARSGTSADRAVFVPLDSVWAVHDAEDKRHAELFGGDEDEEDEEEYEGEGSFIFNFAGARKQQREVTAVLLQLETPAMRLWMNDEIARETESMAARPLDEMLGLYLKVLSPMERTLLVVAYLVVVVAGLSILTTLYQAAERRRRDVAILRALGAKPREVFAIVTLEALLVTALGIGTGWLLGHGGVAIAAQIMQDRMGLVIGAWSVDREELIAIAVVGVVGLIAGFVPAAIAYRRSPVQDLSAS